MTRQYIDGIAIHWYTDDIFPAYLLSETHEHFPEKFILATEASNMPQFGQKPVVLGSWQRGENYSDDIMKV
jgi:glucosylceramidase